MKQFLSFLAIVFFLSLAVGTGEAAQKKVPPKNKTAALSLCTLVDDWKHYHGKPVRVRAIYRVGAEQQWLSDPSCPTDKYLTDVEFVPRTKGATKKLDHVAGKDRRAWVVFDGTFYGPETYKNVDPKLPASIREKLEQSPRRYGHMDSFETMIEVKRVVEASEVPSDVPW